MNNKLDSLIVGVENGWCHLGKNVANLQDILFMYSAHHVKSGKLCMADKVGLAHVLQRPGLITQENTFCSYYRSGE